MELVSIWWWIPILLTLGAFLYFLTMAWAYTPTAVNKRHGIITMRFKNPENGYTEDRSVPWLWTFLFGGFYFLICGLVAPLIIWLFLAGCLYAAFGPPATLLIPIISFVFAALAPGLVRKSYLRKGWVEVEESEPLTNPWAGKKEVSADLQQPKPNQKTPVADKIKPCPFCAEDIKFEAIKCKHCGSDLVHA